MYFIMIEKIQNIYTKICLAILKNADHYKKLIRRSNSSEYIFYIKHLISITVKLRRCINLILKNNQIIFNSKRFILEKTWCHIRFRC